MKTKTYLMSREERERALKAAKAAMHHLWDGVNPRQLGNGKTAALCIAAGNAMRAHSISLRDCNALTDLIDRSLGVHLFYSEWMKARRIKTPPDMGYHEFLQAQRKRWLNHIIKSLEASLKE